MKSKRMLFIRALILSASTIGGGFVIISVLRQIYVDHLHWLTEEEMLDITAIAQSAPGAVAVNASILLGYKLAGVGGAAVCVLGTILPPLVIMSAAAALYQLFRDLPWISKVMRGMQAGVAAVILDAALRMTRTALGDRDPLHIALFLLALAAVLVLDIPSSLVILAALLIGIARFFVSVLWKKHTSRGGRA